MGSGNPAIDIYYISMGDYIPVSEVLEHYTSHLALGIVPPYILIV